MSNVELFNSLGGYSVGIPPKSVIDLSGNIVTNVNAPNANVTANVIYANSYRYANGLTIVTPPSGSNTQVQYNNNGNFGASSSFTFNSTTNTVGIQNLNVTNISNLGNVENVKILGGLNGYFLQTDGTGNLTWTQGGNGGGGNGMPGGANTQVQFNDGGNFGGDSGFTYDKNTNTLHVDNISAGAGGFGNITTNSNIVANGNVTASYFIGNGSQLSDIVAVSANTANTVIGNSQPNITSVGNLTNLVVVGNLVSGNSNLGNSAVANYFTGNGIYLTNITGANVVGVVANSNYASFAGNVTVSDQPNITSVGTLTSLSVSGNIQTGNISTGGTVSAANVTVTGNANINIGGILRSQGNVNFTQSPNVSLGNVSNVKILGGTNGYVLTTDGSGNLTWSVTGGGGNGTPGGTNTQIQYNNNGSFAGSQFLTFDDTNNTLSVAGNLVANTITMGSGVFQFSRSNIFGVNTNTILPNQTLISIPAYDLAGIDFTIIATTGNIRNFVKISCVVMEETVNYVEYSNLPVNGYIGDYQVVYDTGNVIVPASVKLLVSPNSANLTSHKMSITTYIS
jgi:hypothetical protein